MENYYVIRNSEGDTYVERISKQELVKRLNENYYGEEYLNGVPKESDTNYWGGQTLIIKGEVVVPREKRVVTEFDIE